MDLEKLQKELLITNDLVKLKEDDLMLKYGRKESECEDMLRTFSSLLVPGSNYALTLYYTYEKISNFVKKCMNKFPNNKNIIATGNLLLRVIEVEQKRDEEMAEYVDQAIGLFEDSIGVYKLKDLRTIPNLETLLLRNSFDIEDALNDESNKEQYSEYIEQAKDKDEVSKENHYVNDMLIALYLEYPKFRLCFNPQFLITANYLILGHHPHTIASQEFISLVREVMDISKNYQFRSLLNGFNYKQYRKIANLTEKNINKFEKTREGFLQKQEKERKILSLKD